MHLCHYCIYRFNNYYYYYDDWKLLKCETDIREREWGREGEGVFPNDNGSTFMRIHELIYCFIYFMKRIKWYLTWMFAFHPLPSLCSCSFWSSLQLFVFIYARRCGKLLPLLRQTKFQFELNSELAFFIYKIQFISFCFVLILFRLQ